MANCVSQTTITDISTKSIKVLTIDPSNSPPTCPGGLVIYSNTDYTNATTLDPAALGIDHAAILDVFGWGFAAIILFWSIGFGLSVALGLIRKT